MPDGLPSSVSSAGSGFRVRRQVNGRRIQRRFGTLVEAIAFADEIDREFAEARTERKSPVSLVHLTVAELCSLWFEHAQARYSPGGRRNYETAIRVHIAPSALGGTDANRVTPADLHAFYRTLRFTTAKKSHQVLRHAFRWGHEAVPELTRRDNPALNTAPARRECVGYKASRDYEEDEVRPVDEKAIPSLNEIQKLLVDAEASARDWWLYLMIAVGTGARPGEICALQGKHVDIERGVIRIEWSADRVSGCIKRPKTRWSIRTLHLPREFFDEIAPYLPHDPDEFIFRPHHASPMPCWNGRGVYRRLMAAIDRTGLPHYTPHAFRHYYATRLLAEGEPPTQVARRLGHRDDTLIRKLYGRHIDDDAQRRLAERSMRHLFGWG